MESLQKHHLVRFLKEIPVKSLMAIACFLLATTAIGQSSAAADSVKALELFRVIRSAQTDAVKKMLAAGYSANAISGNYSALMAATLNGSAEEMKLLIDYGAEVNYFNSDSISALWLAVPDPEKTKLLLDHHADVKQLSVGRYSVLVKLASIPGTVEIFRLLIEKGIDPKKSAPDNSLLYFAASSCDTGLLKLLLGYGLKPNDTVAFGDYPINAALSFRCFASVKMLVEYGADVNARPMNLPLGLTDGVTPLMFAAVNSDKESFFYLLDHGADPNSKSKNGFTPLMILQLAETTDPAMTLALLKHGAIVSEKALDGTDALYYAKQKGNTEIVAILEKYLHQ
ncbi:MAG TPA: ankyrin repeat domain-containing protein [Puia sp.]|nr:ankyrin repeat domain-containing protein [Puia sp.]